jgi:hypothetical protein
MTINIAIATMMPVVFKQTSVVSVFVEVVIVLSTSDTDLTLFRSRWMLAETEEHE